MKIQNKLLLMVGSSTSLSVIVAFLSVQYFIKTNHIKLSEAQAAFLLTCTVLFILLGVSLLILFSFWISKPIKQFVSVVQGQYDPKNEHLIRLSKRDDEVGLAIKAYHNRMQYIQEIQESISEAVKEKTKELSDVNQQLQLFQKIYENTSQGILITDTNGTILDVNESMCTMTGYERDELVGHNPRILKSGRHGKDFYRKMWSDLFETSSWQGELWDRRKNGEIYPKWLNINGIKGSDGDMKYFVGINTDITVVKSAEEKLSNLAYYDPLTSLANRALFTDRLKSALQKTEHEGNYVAILFLDLDSFKQINDFYGHAVGDELLKIVGKRIQSRLRIRDTVARLGGDEFTIILDDIVNLEDVKSIAVDILEKISSKLVINGNNITVEASIGIAVYPLDADSGVKLMQVADEALYRAKNAGKNMYVMAGEKGNKNT